MGLGAAVAVLITLATVVGIVARGAQSKSLTPGQLLFGLILTVVFEAALLCIAIAMTAGKFGGGPGLVGWRMKPPQAWIGHALLAVVLAWLTLGIYSALTNLPGLGWLKPHGNVPEEIFRHRPTVVLAVSLTVLTAPIAEETFFRGFLFAGLRGRLGFAGAATVSGVLFAIAHESGTLIIPFTVIGVILAWTYYRTGTLLASFTAHCCFNLVSVIFLLAGKGGPS